jgi:hypothetical protein
MDPQVFIVARSEYQVIQERSRTAFHTSPSDLRLADLDWPLGLQFVRGAAPAWAWLRMQSVRMFGAVGQAASRVDVGGWSTD